MGYITHEESMINMFMEDPEYANHLMSVVIADGDENEIKRFQSWYDEAKARRNKASTPHWAHVAAVL